MRTTLEERDRWDLIEDPTSSDVQRLIADVEDAVRLLRDVLDEVPPMQWLMDQGRMPDAPTFAKRIGDAYIFLEEPEKVTR